MADQETTIPRAAPDFTPARPSSAETAPVQPFALGHRPALDGLRGLAILAVLGLHFTGWLVPGGYIGVDLFFVLSGFLITVLLLQEHRASGTIRLRAFYLRRVLRLLPALVVLLLVCWLSAVVFQPGNLPKAIRNDAISILLYYFNWKLAWRPNVHVIYLMPLWSLSLEEQFYLLWPPVLAALLALKVRRRWIGSLILLGMIVPPTLRMVYYSGILGGPLNVMRIYVCPDTHSDGMFSGCMVALAAFHGISIQNLWMRRLIQTAAWAAVVVLGWHCFFLPNSVFYVYVVSYSIVNLCTAVLISALILAPPPLLVWCLQRRWLGWFGRVSYGLYLWHVPVLILAQNCMTRYRIQTVMIVAFAMALAITALSFYCLEQPFLRLKHRLDRRTVRRDPSPQVPVATSRAA